MTPSQLRQWSFQNSQPDQWWLSLDGVTEEIPVTVDEIEERLKCGEYSAAQVLHVSQAGMENASWVEVTMSPLMYPPLVSVLGNKTNEKKNIGESVSEQPIEGSANVIPIRVHLKYVCCIIVAIPALTALAFLSLFPKLKEILFLPVVITLAFVVFFIIYSIWRDSKKPSKEALRKQNGIGAKEVTVQHFFIGMGALVIVIFIMGKLMTGESPKSERKQLSASKVSDAELSGEYKISGDNFTGFLNREDDDRATELASDEEAFSKFFLACVMAKRATLFKKGETVILEEFGGFADSKVKLRRKGEMVSYWTNREAID